MCSEERPCIPCYTDNGLCEDKLNSFLKEATELSYKYGLKFYAPLNHDSIGVCKLHEDDLRGGVKGYSEVVTGSGLVEF